MDESKRVHVRHAPGTSAKGVLVGLASLLVGVVPMTCGVMIAVAQELPREASGAETEGGASAVPAGEEDDALPEVPAASGAASGAGQQGPPSPTDVTTLPSVDDADGFKFRLAPIRWGGNFAQIFRWTQHGDEASTFERLSMLNFRGSSYIWQPWLAQVSGSLNLLTSTQSGSEASKSHSKGATGSGALSLFPHSRFPFTAAFDVSDNRTDSAATSNDYQSRRISLRQSYQPLESNARYNASFDRSSVSSDSATGDSVTTLQAGYSNSFGFQSLEANATRTTSNASENSDGLRATAITARHVYRPDDLMLVETNASLTETALSPATSESFGGTTARYLQSNTYVSWRPGEDVPMYVTGNARFFSATSDFSGNSTNSKSISANGGLTYNPTSNLTLNASAAVAQAMSGENSRLATSQAGNATYTADSLAFGNFSWGWNANAGASNQTGGAEGTNPGAAGGLAHTLNHTQFFNERSSLTFNFTQAVSANIDRVNGDTTTLSHIGGMAWRATPSERLNGTASLSASDSRSRGSQTSASQFVYLQLNAQSRLSPHSNLTANASAQWSRQSAIPGSEGSSSTTASGGVGYQNARAFNVRGLGYSLLANFNTMPVQQRRLGDVDARKTELGYSVEQRLEYRLGRLSMRLTATYADFLSGRNMLVFLYVQREFGAF